MFGWYRELLEIRRENSKENELIETLKHEIEMLRMERDTLLNHALKSNQQEIKSNESVEYKPIPPRNLPWNIRKQMLEREAREAAKLRNKVIINPILPEETTIEELEKEMNIVEEERNS